MSAHSGSLRMAQYYLDKTALNEADIILGYSQANIGGSMLAADHNGFHSDFLPVGCALAQ
jgi:hypothetical protein